MRTPTRTDRLRSKLFRRPLVAAVLPAAMLIASACSSNGGSSPSPRAGAAVEWQQANHDLANTRNASDSAISSENVDQMGVGWTYGIQGASAFGSLATSPLVVNGTVYLQDLKSNVYAIDFRSGELVWQKRYNEDNVGPNGPGFDDGKLFVTKGSQTVVALDATNGEEIWSKRIVSVVTQGITQQLTAHEGILYVSTVPGSSISHFYEGGGIGIIHALDERTGDELWSFETVKKGALWGNPKVNSGGGAWYPPAVDTNGTTYWGIGNPAPFPGTKAFPNGSSRPGPNLYTDSELALDSSGTLQWFQQVKSHDLSDADFQSPPILTTATIGGAARDIVLGSGKLGHVVAFDRQSGEELWDTPVGLHRNDDLKTIPTGKTVTVAPGFYGGVETPMALAGGVVFVPVVNVPTDYTATGMTQPNVSRGTGELDAIDVNTGAILWTAKLDAPDFGGALVSGDLVFTSTFTGEVLAFDRASGDQVWSFQAPGGINSPMSAAGGTLLVPVGLGSQPMLLALTLGGTGTISPATPSAGTPTTAPSPSPSGSSTLQISTPNEGDGILFDTDQLTASAGAHVTLTYTNGSAIPHDWHLFDGADASAPSIASTKIQAGPDDVERVSFTVPSAPGRYYFQCDVHPSLMTGFLIVR